MIEIFYSSGGRLCTNQEIIRAAFRYALNHIKPTDGIVVGLFTMQFDEVSADIR